MLSDKPQWIDKDTWYFEEKSGINIVHEIKIDNHSSRCINIKIPWKSLEDSLKKREQSVKRKNKTKV